MTETGTGGPLAGIRVVELGGIGPGPYACLLLAELGADVLRVERPGGGGLDVVPSPALYRSRPCAAVDVKSPAGREVVLRLASGADVLVEGMRPGVVERLGLGPEAVLARNPRLVYARMTGWGQEGPLARRAGHDITYAALTGLLHTVGTAERPVPPANYLADFAGGTMFLVTGVLAALLERERSGKGQVVDAAMVDGLASIGTMIFGMLSSGCWRDERQANLLDGGVPFYDTYRCADGRHVAVGALEPQFYAELLEGLGLVGALPGAQWDRAHWPAHREAIARAFATRTRDEWAARFEGTDACVAPVLGLAEAPKHPHLAARRVFTEVGGELLPRVAPRFSRTPGLDPTPASVTGQDTVTSLLARGFAKAEVDELLAAKVVVQAG